MRLGVVERGNYKTVEYADLSGYSWQVNDFDYDFGRIIEETRQRIRTLWGFEAPPDLLRTRLHFSEERYFNRMVKNEHYGIFSRHTGAHVCLGLVDEIETCDLVIHEIAHEIHFRQGLYDGADATAQEAVAIMAEEEFAVRAFDWNPHFTAQQFLHQLNELPGFGPLSFGERWSLITRLRSSQQISYFINRLLDEADGGSFEDWLSRKVGGPNDVRLVVNAVAWASEHYALYNRRLLLARLIGLGGYSTLSGSQITQLSRALHDLKKLDQLHPQESLAALMERAFAGF